MDMEECATGTAHHGARSVPHVASLRNADAPRSAPYGWHGPAPILRLRSRHGLGAAGASSFRSGRASGNHLLSTLAVPNEYLRRCATSARAYREDLATEVVLGDVVLEGQQSAPILDAFFQWRDEDAAVAIDPTPLARPPPARRPSAIPRGRPAICSGGRQRAHTRRAQRPAMTRSSTPPGDRVLRSTSASSRRGSSSSA